MNKHDTNHFMKQAVPLAKTMEGDWNLRMKMALNSVIVDHYMKMPISKTVIQLLLVKGVSYRRICKHYGVYRHQLKNF